MLAFLIVFTGCSKEPKCSYNECAYKAPAAEIQAVKDYLTANNITATEHCSGLFYRVENPGTGTRPSQFFATIDSERWARLPRSLARSALIRLRIPSWE